MSLHKGLRVLLVAAALGSLALLGGCTLTPVHGGTASQQVLGFSYAEPASRLEQVFYQTLSARFGHASGTGAPHLSASVSVSSTRLGLASVSSPVTDHQITASVSYTVRQGGTVIASGSRRASAPYQTTGQTITADAARAAAEEQAVRAAAEQVRLALIGALAAR